MIIVIKDVVTFNDTEESNQLWGTVAEDLSCRWNQGDWCCTSQILDQIDDGVFITKNTRYTTQGSGEKISLPVKALISLRQGVSPEEWLFCNNYRNEIEPGQE